MAAESAFVALTHTVAQELLGAPLQVARGAALLYQVTVDNQLELTVNPKHPTRGASAFQTDLCIFEMKSENVAIPRVVLEFKTRISTHDVLTYSAKATKHKQVYPYLRYGLVASDETAVPGRLFTHNESLDFCATLGGLSESELRVLFGSLFAAEVEASRRLEAIAFGAIKTRLFRTEVRLDSPGHVISNAKAAAGIQPKPIGNIANSEPSTQSSGTFFPLTLQQTYFNQGFFNVGVSHDEFVRKTDGPVRLRLGNGGEEIGAKVSRNVNRNGTARVLGGAPLRNWFQTNFKPMDALYVDLGSQDVIVLSAEGIAGPANLERD